MAEVTEQRVHVTPNAVRKIREAFAREGVSGGLRLGVLGGGCSRLSYQFKFSAEPRARDHVFENPHATKSCGCGTSFSA